MRDGAGQKNGRGDKKEKKTTFTSLQNRYWIIVLVPKTDFLISMWQPNPLGDAPKYTKRLQKT